MDLEPVAASSPVAPRFRNRALERVEDAFLLLVIILAVPAVMLLLAVPFAVLLRVAEMVGAL